MNDEKIAEKILTCPHCGCDEFKVDVSQYDIVRVVNGQWDIIRCEEPFNDGTLMCAECDEIMPPLNKAGDEFDLSAPTGGKA